MKRAKEIIIGIIIFTVILIASFDRKHGDVTNLSGHIKNLKEEINHINNKLSDLNINLIKSTPLDKCILSTSMAEKGYLAINNKADGIFFISLEDIKNDDGYKAILLIGNPSQVTYYNVTIKIEYRSQDGQQSIKSIYKKIEKDILPGIWNRVAVELPDFSSDSDISVSIFESKNVRLHNDYRVAEE